MSTDLPIKFWAIAAVMTDTGLSFEKAGQAIGVPGEITSPLSPVEFLLLSAAGCMTLSLKAAAIAADQSLANIRVVATGTKPGTAPSRLNTLTLEILLTPGLPRQDADRLIAAAQQMCTVTNTIRDSARLEVKIADPVSASSVGDATHSSTETGHTS